MRFNTQGYDGREALRRGAHVSCQITVWPQYTQTEPFNLLDDVIVQGSVVLDSAGTTTDDIELGCVCSSQLSFSVRESSSWGADDLAGARITAWARWPAQTGPHTTETATMVLFTGTIDAVKKSGTIFECVALDDMVLLDKEYPVNRLDWSMSYLDVCRNAIRQCIQSANFTSSYNVNANASKYPVAYTDPFAPREGETNPQKVTYRQIVSWLCQVMGCAVRITTRAANQTREFEFVWFDPQSADNKQTLELSDRYSSERALRTINYTGIRVHKGESTYLYGTEGYVLDLEDNPFFNRFNYERMLENVLGRLQLNYYPMQADVVSMAYLEPFDMIDYVDKDGQTYTSLVTNATITINGPVSIEAKGESAEYKGYAGLNPMTNAQQAVIEGIRDSLTRQREEYTEAENNLLSLNDMIANSLGLYKTVVDDGSGGSIIYYHNAATLAASTYIFTMNAGGFAYTDHWDGDQTVWQGGIDRNGNAVINMLTLYKLYADYIVAGTMTSRDGTFKINLDNNQLQDLETGTMSRNFPLTIDGENIKVAFSINTLYGTTINGGDISFAFLATQGETTRVPIGSAAMSGYGGFASYANYNTLIDQINDVVMIVRANGNRETIDQYLSNFSGNKKLVVQTLIYGAYYSILEGLLEENNAIRVETVQPDGSGTTITKIDLHGVTTFKVQSDSVTADEYDRKGFPLLPLGGSNYLVPSTGIDCNSAVNPGIYGFPTNASANASQNMPTGANAGKLVVEESVGVTWTESVTVRYIMQTYTSYDGNLIAQRRGSTSDGGSSWTLDPWKILHSSSQPYVTSTGSSGRWRWRVWSDGNIEAWVRAWQAFTTTHQQGTFYVTDDFTVTIPSDITIPQGSFIVATAEDKSFPVCNARVSANNEVTFRFQSYMAWNTQLSIGYNFYIRTF